MDNSGREDGRRRREGPITRIVQGVAAGIGLAEESYHHHKEKKAQEAQVHEVSHEEDVARDAPAAQHPTETVGEPDIQIVTKQCVPSSA